MLDFVLLCADLLGGSEGVRGWGLINGLVLKEESPVLAGAVVAETTKLGLLLVPAGLKVTAIASHAFEIGMILRSEKWWCHSFWCAFAMVCALWHDDYANPP